jgi:predicted dehydrogenase
MRKLKIGIIGIGGIADYYIACMKDHAEAELWAICDSNEERLAQRGAELAIPEARRYVHYEQLLQCHELDAVMIGTPNFSHVAIASAAVKYRKPFALEKPIALLAEEAVELYAELKRSPLPHMICFSYRYKAAARYARHLIQQGKLGQIYHVYSQYLQSWAINEELPLLWRFNKALTGSGALGDLGSHILDLHRFLVGDTQRVIAHGDTIVGQRPLLDGTGKGTVDVDDYCHVLAKMDNGISSSMQISRFAYGRGNYQRIEIYGSKGALVYNLEEHDSLEACFAEDGDSRQFKTIEIPQQFQADQLQSFIHVLTGKGDGLDATVEDGYVNQKTLDAIVESFEQERWINV